MKLRLIFLVLAISLGALASEGRRVAVLVGANRGALGRESLRYSYRDAREMAAVLTQVGHFEPQDVHVLSDPRPDEVLSLLDAQLKSLSTMPGESLLLFYYSGHADEAALYPGGSALRFSDLRERLESPLASVRIGIMDACSGGGWTGTKGLHPGAPFAVDVPLQLSGEGSVLISSSSGVEAAHESSRLEGSFFTHHLVAALRGAADRRGAGVVTLTDAFGYARERTVRDTAAVGEPQHPSFSMNLRGRTDLPLAHTLAAAALVELRETQGPLQVIDLGTGLIVLEVGPGKKEVKLAIPPGRYLVRREEPGGNLSREVAVQAGITLVVQEEDLVLSGSPAGAGKGLGGRYGQAFWPLALNDRPLTLAQGLMEFEIGFVLAQSPAPLNSAIGFTPAFRFGLSDRTTLSLGAPGGLCVGHYPYSPRLDSNGDRACANLSAGLNAGLEHLLLPHGPLELSTNISLGFQDGLIPLTAGMSARIGGGGPLALRLSSRLRYLAGASSAGSSGLTLGFGAEANLQLRRTLALQLRVTEPLEAPALEYDQYRNSTLLEWRPLIVAAGATYTVSPQIDLHGEVGILNIGRTQGYAAGDYRTVSFSASFRR